MSIENSAQISSKPVAATSHQKVPMYKKWAETARETKRARVPSPIKIGGKGNDLHLPGKKTTGES